MNDYFIKDYPGSLYGNYRQIKFADVWEAVEDFLADYSDNGIPTTISETSAKTVFYLLYSRFGNNVIASSDTNRFKYDLFATIFSYGPVWEKRVDIQNKLCALDDDDIVQGVKQIYNHAYNPGTAPSTSTLEELTAINEQNTNIQVRDKLTAYETLWNLLRTDVTEAFLDKFKKLFLKVVQPEVPLWYVEEDT